MDYKEVEDVEDNIMHFQQEISYILNRLNYGDDITDPVNKKIMILKILIPLYNRLSVIKEIDCDVIYDNIRDIVDLIEKSNSSCDEDTEDDIMVNDQLVKELERYDNIMSDRFVRIHPIKN